MSLKDWDRTLKPREKVRDSGIDSLSDSELLALILRNGSHGEHAVALASRILNQTGGLSGLVELPLNRMQQLPGIGLAKACEILACLEFSRRSSYQKMLLSDVIASPDQLVAWLKSSIGRQDQEYFLAIFLNEHNRVISHASLAQGSGNVVSVKPADIFSQAIRLKAASLIIAHNHPSQHVEPSLADKLTTRQLLKAGEMLNIPLQDHIIVAYDRYFSFRQHQIL